MAPMAILTSTAAPSLASSRTCNLSRASRHYSTSARVAPGPIAKDFNMTKTSQALVLTAFLAAATGCSLKKFAINKIGDSLASSGTTYAADDDLELVGQALPFGLKLIESLLAETPNHQGLLLAAASGFTEYAYVYVQQDAEIAEDVDLARTAALRARARRFYLRARDYGLRGLERRHRGFTAALRRDPRSAVADTNAAAVPLLYWTAASWGSAISVSKDNPELVADQLIIEALIDRAYALNADYQCGSIDGFLITYELARQGARGDPVARARMHFDRQVRLTRGQLAAPFVSFAEAVSVQNQDRAEFEALLARAAAIDPDARPEWRLHNLATQRRVRWLMERRSELFAK
jgi:predicted anti-sigma-YlaC factor YlaD